MATKKPTFKAAEVVSADTFEEELEVAINRAFKDAAEFKGALECELAVLKSRILDIHKAYVQKESEDIAKQLTDASKTIEFMNNDMNSLKTVILRMAITQYGG